MLKEGGEGAQLRRATWMPGKPPTEASELQNLLIEALANLILASMSGASAELKV